jgi:hypothetical protein
VRIETIVGRLLWIFGNQLQIFIELHDSAGMMALGASHHGDQKPAVAKRVKLISDRRLRRVGGRNKFWGFRVGEIKEKDFLLAF